MARIRAAAILLAVLAVTVPLMPLQALLLRLDLPAARTLPCIYHRMICRLINVRVTISGTPAQDRPLLLVCNHVSWLDIPVLSAALPVSFIAKSEVRGWPLVGWLARLQRTVFVDRQRRRRTGEVTGEIVNRLRNNEAMVLFAEGTSGDGNRLLPFRSALLGAAETALEGSGGGGVVVQPAAIAYLRLNGLPMGRQHRPVVAWYGDMELPSHLWALLCAGPIDVTVSFGGPIDLSAAGGRKGAAGAAEASVRRMFTAALIGSPESSGAQPASTDG